MKYKTLISIILIHVLLLGSSSIAQVSNHHLINTVNNSFFGNGNETVIIINYAGNFKDTGGPFWLPPNEIIQINGSFENGYYTNESRQEESYIYINLTVINDDGIESVWLQWLNETTWTNWTYSFSHTTENYWEINTSSIIQTKQGYNYSFNVVANDTIFHSITVEWAKIGTGGRKTRRYVQLNCDPTDIFYKPWYFYPADYQVSDFNTCDRLHHDQGTDGSLTDTGYLFKTEPTSDVQKLHCDHFVGYWFDESVCIKSKSLQNIYYHFWWNSRNDMLRQVGYGKSKDYFKFRSADQTFNITKYSSKSTINYNSINHYLESRLMHIISPPKLTDNDVYELFMYFDSKLAFPQIINNRSFLSYVIFNVPDNDTLNSTYYDSDHDGLSDWSELYETYTSPFHFDTDNDGATDYEETYGSENGYKNSDPNNYSDITTFRVPLSIKITKPNNAIYFNNRRITPFLIPIIIRNIDIEVDLPPDHSRLKKVEFYIDDNLKNICYKEPFICNWKNHTLFQFKHTIKVIAYNSTGDIVNDEITVWKFFQSRNY